MEQCLFFGIRDDPRLGNNMLIKLWSSIMVAIVTVTMMVIAVTYRHFVTAWMTLTDNKWVAEVDEEAEVNGRTGYIVNSVSRSVQSHLIVQCFVIVLQTDNGDNDGNSFGRCYDNISLCPYFQLRYWLFAKVICNNFCSVFWLITIQRTIIIKYNWNNRWGGDEN